MVKIIKNKRDSKRYIEGHGFNHLPDKFIHKDDVTGMKNFLESFSAPLYIIRDGLRPQSDFFFFRTYDECKVLLEKFVDVVILAVSVNAYKKNKVILGTIKITSDNMVELTASTSIDCDHRSIFIENDYNLHCSIFSKQLDNVPRFDEIYEFLVTNLLIDVIVEYTIYDIKVGINNEYLVIQEIRHY